MYMIIKHTHLLFIVISFLLFFSRGILMMRKSPLANHRAFVIAPHAVNLFLILSGVYLAFLLQITPASDHWLMTKLSALVVYIMLGIMTFKHPSMAARKLFWLLALVVFAFMVSVARSKNAYGFFAPLFS